MESSPQVSSWLMFSLPELSTHYKLYILPHLMPLLFPLMNILLTGGLINLLCLCLEVHHQWSSDRGPMFALARYLLPSAIFSTVCNIPKCLLMKTVQHEGYILSLMTLCHVLFVECWSWLPPHCGSAETTSTSFSPTLQPPASSLS